MNTNYEYTTQARWTSGRGGIMKAESIEQPIKFSSPPEFLGERGLWTPEHFLVAAVAGCFVSTFAAMAEMSKLEVLSFEVFATGSLEKIEGGLRFNRVIIRPEVVVYREADRDRALRLLEKAEHTCLIARSLRSEIVLEPEVLVQAPVSAT
jgi:peroxiredoxin-like protein